MVTATMEKRQEAALRAEEHVFSVISKTSPLLAYHRFHNPYSRLDGMIINRNEGTIVGVYEIKCRNIKFADVVGNYSCELLIDTHKVESLQTISHSLRVASYLFTYLMGDGVILRIQITNDKGDYVCEKREEVTVATKNLGGVPVEKPVTQIRLDGGTIIATREPLGEM